jgi:hypothetical protein
MAVPILSPSVTHTEKVMILTLNSLTTTAYHPFDAAWRVVRSVLSRQRKLPTQPIPTVEIIGKGVTLTLQRPAGYRITCLEGCVWITVDDDTRDFVISAGRSFCPARNARVLVHALEASRVTIFSNLLDQIAI